MSKSNLKPEDVFFGLQKTHERKNQAIEKAAAEAAAKEEPETEAEEPKDQEDEKPEPAEPSKTSRKSTPSKKRGPRPNAENARRVPVNVFLPPELKYSMTLVINQMKYLGIKDRYNITDFVLEAVEEKVRRSKKQLGME